MVTRRVWAVTPVLSAVVWMGLWGGEAMAGRRPGPPGTDRFSVQMFQGATQFCWIAVYPPVTYDDGNPIPDGTPVQIRVFRSLDGGKTYKTQGVSLVAGGQGVVGQGEHNARQKRWIDCKLKTPVDNQPPHAVWLAAWAVGGGVASAATNRYLTFRYVGNDGRPRLIRYETPDITGFGVDDELARPLPQELAGQWPDGEIVVKRMWVSPEADPKTREQCSNSLKANLNKPRKAILIVDQIDLVGAPGLQGLPVDPSQLTKVHFPGKARLVMPPTQPRPGQKPPTIDLDFVYDYRERSIHLESRKNQGAVVRMGGAFFQTATHYSIHGTWKMSLYDKQGREMIWGRGPWTVKKPKR